MAFNIFNSRKTVKLFNIPRCKIDSSLDNGYLHSFFVESIIRDIKDVHHVAICPLTGIARVHISSYNPDETVKNILNIRDKLGNKIVVYEM